MSVSFLRQTEGAGVPSVMEQGNEKPARRTAPTTVVSLTDGQREAAIALASSQMVHYMEQWERYGVFSDHAAAEACKERMYALIRGRSAAQVARMEQERGLA